MQVVLVFVLLGYVWAGAASREKRQVLTQCPDDNIANVCTNTGGRIYFPHPTDSTKFLQCADGGRMFIIKCPKGELYNKDRTACTPSQVTNPVTNPNNPCTAQNIALGNIFFPYVADKTKFIECNGLGQPILLSCPSRLAYDAGRKSCVLQQGTVVNGGSTGGTVPVNTGGVVSGGNPCTAQAILSNNLFFPHPDPTKFIQCDLAGDAYVMSCPANLVWSQALGRNEAWKHSFIQDRRETMRYSATILSPTESEQSS